MCPQTRSLVAGAVMSFLLAASHSAAAAPTKEDCLDAHSRGQDQREAGHLALARDSFAVCSQPACPALVQSDCARFSEELARLSPSLGFAARDQRGSDLPDTQVYVDGVLVARRLDDGKSYDVDPGKHAVRFLHGERTVLLNIVVNEGEHGRSVLATFDDPSEPPLAAPVPETRPAREERQPVAREPKRGAFPLVVAIAGGAAIATGAVLMGVGFGKVPANCSLQTNECTAPPGDPAFDRARDGVALVNVGLSTAIAGAVVGIGGLVWYLAQSPTPEQHPSAKFKFTGTGFAF